MQLTVLCITLILYFGASFRTGRRPTLTSLGIVYFAAWSIVGGVRVLTKCFAPSDRPLQFDEQDLICVGFGIIAMVWIAIIEIWKQIAIRQP